MENEFSLGLPVSLISGELCTVGPQRLSLATGKVGSGTEAALRMLLPARPRDFPVNSLTFPAQIHEGKLTRLLKLSSFFLNFKFCIRVQLIQQGRGGGAVTRSRLTLGPHGL